MISLISTVLLQLNAIVIFPRLLFLFVISCWAPIAVAQNNEFVDSLNKILSDPAAHDTTRMKARYDLGESGDNFRIGFWDSIANDCERVVYAMPLFRSDSNQYKIAKVYIEIGADAVNNIGFVHFGQSNIPEALVYFEKALKLRKVTDDKVGTGLGLNNMAAIYNSQGNYEKALEYYQESLALRLTIGDERGVAIAYNNIGQLYNNMGLKITKACNCENDSGYFELSRINYYKGLEIFVQRKDEIGLATTFNNLGHVYDCSNDADSALFYYGRALELRRKIGDRSGLAYTLANRGRLLYNLGNTAAALSDAQEGLKLAKEVGQPQTISLSAHLLADIYALQRKGNEALEMYKLHIVMRDSVKNTESIRLVTTQQVNFENDKQKAIDDALHLDKINQLDQQAELDRQNRNRIILVVSIGFFIVLVFSFFLANRYRITRRQKNIIEKQKEEVTHQKHLVEEKNKEITDSITYAKRIQNAILPKSKMINAFLPDSFVLYRPKDIVAGDFYWFENSGDLLLFAAADCTGHGVPGAMVSVVCNGALNRSVREFGLNNPGKILDQSREIVIAEFEKSDEEVKDGMDISLCALSLSNHSLNWSGANNPLWILRAGSDAMEEIKADKQPIGKYTDAKPFSTHATDLKKGDSIYIFTDGYQDQFGGPKGKKFKASALKELLVSLRHQSMQQQKEKIDQAFESWKGSLEQVDDVCVIGVRI